MTYGAFFFTSKEGESVKSQMLLLYMCVFQLNMPRSPTSSEEEMAQSFSDSSQDCSSHSSRDEVVYETIRAGRPAGHMTDTQSSSLSVRVFIPDLQQTVSVCPLLSLCLKHHEHFLE